MNHLIVIPAIDPANLAACLDSMDPTVRERVMVIDNTDDGSIWDSVPTCQKSYRNIGVAASWNAGCRAGFEAGADFVTVCSSSMRFDPDGGVALTSTADFASAHRQWLWGFESLNGWHLFTVGRLTWERIGEFDEVFWPAYFEDNDYIWRMRCAGILPPAGPHTPDRKIPWIPTISYPCAGDALAVKSGAVTVDLAALEARYCEKWGGPPGHERWTSAYGDR